MKWIRSTACASNACVEVAFTDDAVLLRSSTTDERIAVTPDEWTAFVEGVKRGEFESRKPCRQTVPGGPSGWYVLHEHGDGVEHGHHTDQKHQGDRRNARANDHTGVEALNSYADAVRSWNAPKVAP